MPLTKHDAKVQIIFVNRYIVYKKDEEKSYKTGQKVRERLDFPSKTARRDEFLSNYLDDKRNMLTFATWKEKTK